MTRIMLKNIVFVLILLFPPALQAADFTWTDERGARHQLDEYRGKPLLLHLWASWCPPCRTEMPELTAWLKKHPEVTILPVSLDRNIADARNFLDRNHFDLPALLTDSGQAMGLGARGLPTTIVISADGRIERGFIGARDWNDPSFSDLILESFPAPASN